MAANDTSSSERAACSSKALKQNLNNAFVLNGGVAFPPSKMNQQNAELQRSAAVFLAVQIGVKGLLVGRSLTPILSGLTLHNLLHPRSGASLRNEIVRLTARQCCGGPKLMWKKFFSWLISLTIWGEFIIIFTQGISTFKLYHSIFPLPSSHLMALPSLPLS